MKAPHVSYARSSQGQRVIIGRRTTVYDETVAGATCGAHWCDTPHKPRPEQQMPIHPASQEPAYSEQSLPDDPRRTWAGDKKKPAMPAMPATCRPMHPFVRKWRATPLKRRHIPVSCTAAHYPIIRCLGSGTLRPVMTAHYFISWWAAFWTAWISAEDLCS